MNKGGVPLEKKLLQGIEEARRNLYVLALTASIAAPEVIKLSQKLDYLLNQYQAIQAT